jgi:hypothetical protein
MRRALVVSVMIGIMLSAQLRAQARPYPAAPRALPEADEIALAMSAAPEEISAHADIYVLRGTEFVKARRGTNGCACMVARDLHDEGRYPICYDQEGARTLLFRELMEGSLRAKGLTEADVQKAVDAAYAKGELRMPSKASMAYMMSPKQVLFSSPNADGRRVGAWSPHLMLMMPSVEPSQLGLAHESKVDVIQVHNRGASHSELVVKVPKWSDGTPVAVSAPAKAP